MTDIACAHRPLSRVRKKQDMEGGKTLAEEPWVRLYSDASAGPWTQVPCLRQIGCALVQLGHPEGRDHTWPVHAGLAWGFASPEAQQVSAGELDCLEVALRLVGGCSLVLCSDDDKVVQGFADRCWSRVEGPLIGASMPAWPLA